MAKIIVTGAYGHIGRHLVEELKGNDLFFIDLSIGIHTKDIKKVCYYYEPDIIYHLGEYARIAPSFNEPSIVYDRNIIGTQAVVEYCRLKHCKLVYAASSTKYDDPSANPYSFTKSVNVDLINNYGKWYGLDYAICYFNNAFGPGETATGKYATLIGKFMYQYISGEALTVVKPGTQKRNFTYVKDLVKGMVLIGEKGHGDGYVLYNPKAYSVLQVAKMFKTKIKMVDGYSGRKKSGNFPTKALELGWKPTLDLKDYINSIIKPNGNPQTN
jgi:UDP-glucose 4-epimerase